MSEIFISYARSTEGEARRIAEALRALGYDVWWDEQLPVHRDYSEVLEERLRAARAVVVLWSAEAAKSQWVRAEADVAREAGKLVQLTLDGAPLPMPFNRIQCADLAGWTGEAASAGWRKVVDSIAELAGTSSDLGRAPADAPLALPSKPSIAVLPFVNLSNDPEQDYFADGMVEEIVAALTRFKSLFVIGSGSTFAFKTRSASPQDAARELGVRYVLEGSVRRASNRVRITAKLMDATDGAQIWTERFEETLDDVFALQDRVALAAAGAIEPNVTSVEMARAARRPTEDLTSYDLYLRAIAAIRSQNKEGFRQAQTHLERAVALDPDFGEAWSLLSTCHLAYVQLGWSDPDDAARRKEEAGRARREALKTASDNATALASAALQVLDFEMDFGGAVDLVERAIALNPGSALVWMYSGIVRLRRGEIDLSAEHFETAMRLDPIGAAGRNASGFLAGPRFLQGRYEEAITHCKRYLQHTESPIPYAILAACHGRLGDREAARAALASYRERTPMPIEDYVKSMSRRPEHLADWLDAVAAIQAN